MVMPAELLLQFLEMPSRISVVADLDKFGAKLVSREDAMNDIRQVLFNRHVQDLFIIGFAVGDDTQVEWHQAAVIA